MFKGEAGRLYLIRIIMVAGLFAAMSLSLELWSSNRFFPRVTLLPFSLPWPSDLILAYIFSAGAMLSLVYAGHRLPLIIMLATGVLLVLSDLTRMQPWFYQYLLMTFIFLVHGTGRQQKLFRLLFGFTYLWSGIHKVTPVYFERVAPWLSEIPADAFTFMPPELFKYLFIAGPFIELVAGAGLLLSGHRIFVYLLMAMHLIILLITGPLGMSYNQAIWPWNIIQLVLLPLVFNQPSQAWRIKRHDMTAVGFAVVTGILPFFNFFGMWPSYMSFNLYSGTTAYGYLYLGADAARFTPMQLKEKYFPDLEKSYRIELHYWAMDELGVPPFPEKVTYKAAESYFQSFSPDSSQVVLSYFPRRLPWWPADRKSESR